MTTRKHGYTANSQFELDPILDAKRAGDHSATQIAISTDLAFQPLLQHEGVCMVRKTMHLLETTQSDEAPMNDATDTAQV